MCKITEAERLDKLSVISELVPCPVRVMGIRSETDEFPSEFLEPKQYVLVKHRRPAVIVLICLRVDFHSLAFMCKISKHRVEDVAEIPVQYT